MQSANASMAPCQAPRTQPPRTQHCCPPNLDGTRCPYLPPCHSLPSASLASLLALAANKEISYSQVPTGCR